MECLREEALHQASHLLVGEGTLGTEEDEMLERPKCRSLANSGYLKGVCHEQESSR